MLKMYVQCHKQASCIEVRRGKKANGRKNENNIKSKKYFFGGSKQKTKKNRKQNTKNLAVQKEFCKENSKIFIYYIFTGQ